jgi:hypothetical protein
LGVTYEFSYNLPKFKRQIQHTCPSHLILEIILLRNDEEADCDDQIEIAILAPDVGSQSG